MAAHTALETVKGVVEMVTNRQRPAQLTAPPLDGRTTSIRLFPSSQSHDSHCVVYLGYRWVARRLRKFWKPPGARSDTSISEIRAVSPFRFSSRCRSEH